MKVLVAIAQLNLTVGAMAANAEKIIQAARRAHDRGAHILVTPELSLTGYPPEDLLLRDAFYTQTNAALEKIIDATHTLAGLHILVGLPVQREGERFNTCAVLCEGKVLGSYYKHDLPNYDVFDEQRYFTPDARPLVFSINGICFGVNICEDIWFPYAPSAARAAGAQVLLVPNASPYHMHKSKLRIDVVEENVCKQGMACIYANLIGGQDELVFDGGSFVLNSKAQITTLMPQFVEELEFVTIKTTEEQPQPQLGRIMPELSVEAQVYEALKLGVRDYLGKNGFPGAILGLSGGIDSALTLAIAVDALGADKVRAVMMPSKYTADISLIDSRDMVERIGVRYDELSISSCFDAFLGTLSGEFAGTETGTTEENIQARIRGTMLMALSNKFGSVVLTTGNKSEMATGYCTLYGDMAGGFAVLKDIMKTMVFRLARYRNTLGQVIPERIITRPPSAELRENQTDQDSLPPYDTLDAIIGSYMEANVSIADIIAEGYDATTVKRVVHLIKINEYKRRQAPVGIRVTHRAFGRDWRYPITNRFTE
jgi:NAD+ synthase (glutamine-hydrolysing)